MIAPPVCELDDALAREEALIEEHGQDPIITEAEVEAIIQEELWTALLEDHPPTYAPRLNGRPKGGPAELDNDQ